LTLRQSLLSRVTGGGLNEYHRLAADGAWSRDEAIEVIEGLKGTTVAVSEVLVFDPAPWGYAK